MQTAEINSIDTTLRELAPLVTDVQRTLEAGLDEGGAGAESVAAVVQPLATIRGTLELLDLHGAAILVREMGDIATAVSGGQTDESEQALEALLEAVLRLPDYLDRIRAGQRDTPALLLFLVNRLRALRGAERLDEGALFFPPLPAFGRAAEAADDERLQGVAQRVRGRFQRALLGWYRGTADGGEPLAEFVEVLQELAADSAQPAVAQLWQVGAAFAASLADDDGAAADRGKTLLARLERVIAEAARGGESSVAQASPGELLRGLLYHVARTPSAHADVRAVQQTYELERALPASDGESEFGGLNRELLDAVGEGIRTELAQIKDAVEIYVHGEERRTEVLEGLPEQLKQIADTFSMLGLSQGHATLRGEAQVLAEIDALGADDAEQRLQTLADELLRAEGELARLERGRAPQEADGEDSANTVLGIRKLPDSEYEPLLAAVVGASLENLSKVREAIGVYCSNPEPDPETVSEIPALLAEIEGAAMLLPLQSATPLVAGLREYAEHELTGAGRQPDDNAQVLIADVVAGLEYYLEAVAHDRLAMTHLLEGAVRALDALRSGGTPEIYDEDEQVVIEAPADAPAAGAPGRDDKTGPAGTPDGAELELGADAFDLASGADDSSGSPESATLDLASEDNPAPPSDASGGLNAESGPDSELSFDWSSLDEGWSGEPDEPTSDPTVEAAGEPAEPGPVQAAEFEGFDLGSDASAAPAGGSDAVALEAASPDADFSFDWPPLDDATGEPHGADESGSARAADAAGDAAESGGPEAVPVAPSELEASDFTSEGAAPASDAGSLHGASVPEPDLGFDFDWPSLDDAGSGDPDRGAGPGAQAATDHNADDLGVAPEADSALAVGHDGTLDATAEGSGEAGHEPARQGAHVEGLSAAGAGNSAAVANGSQYAIVGDDVDEDVVEVYIEEALGELDKINEHLPRWKANPADEDAVIVIRRAYHTLKGGGRLIGAELLGEFSWSMENLLNRVIDGSVKASAAVYETLDEASAALPQLVEQIQGNRAPIDGLDELIARAHALSRGETPPAPTHPITAPGSAPASADANAAAARAQLQPAGVPDDGAAGVTQAAQADGRAQAEAPAEAEQIHSEQDQRDTASPEQIAPDAVAETDEASPAADDTDDNGPDRTLLEIFAREAAGHQDALRSVFGGADAAEMEMEIDQAFSRPIHTLVGSSQTAGVDAIAELSGALEDIVRARREQRGVLEPEDVGLFAEAVDAIDRVLADLPQLGRVETADVRERLEAQRQAVLAASDSAENQSDDQLLDVFLGEGDELLEQCDRAVAHWREQPDSRAPIGELQRSLHTLKGGARMANLTPIADLTHELESVINGVDAHGTVPNDSVLELLQETVDALTILMEQARAQQPIARVDWLIDDLREVVDHTEDAPAEPAEPASGPAPDIGAETRGADARGAGDAGTEVPAETRGPESAGAAGESPLEAYDAGAGAGDAVAPGPPDPAAAIDAGARAAANGTAPNDTDPFGEAPAVEAPDAAASAGAERATAETASAARDDGPGTGAPATAQSSSDQVRVEAAILDSLVNYAGEVSIYHSRLNEQMGQYRFNLKELEQTVSRLRSQLRTMEDETESQILYRNQARLEAGETTDAEQQAGFDPLEFDRYTRLQELSRSLSESIGDLDSLKEIMETITRDAETLLLQQSRVSSELQDGLMQTRMVRFDGLRGRLARVVRQTAGQMGKKAQLTLTGGEVELDRSVQERTVAPLEHVLRNAVAHGIEAPDERERRGKPAQGTIQLDLHRGGTDIVIEVIDDGSGIDPEAVRRRAIDRGLIDANDDRDDGEVIRLVLETGFSTADSVTQIAGRGVGLDVVESEIRRLGGTLGINTEAGRGTRFIVRLPVTLAINQAVLVETGDDTYAIPIASVEGVAQVSAGELKPMYVDPSQPFRYASSEYRLEHLGRLLGTSEPRLDNPDLMSPVILVRAGDERIALHVEQLVGRRDIVVKPIGAPVNELAGLSGATIMPDGRVILILDIGGLLRTESRFVATGTRDAAAAPAGEAEAIATQAPGMTVLVVDDSITIRKVTQRVLERNGYHVVTAKDGMDALAWMARSVPDLMLLDIEMPRMDGYEVATYVRGEERLAQVPIIMITSRTGDKHRGRAEKIGVNRYLGKPYQETELMENIEHLLNSSTAV